MTTPPSESPTRHASVPGSSGRPRATRARRTLQSLAKWWGVLFMLPLPRRLSGGATQNLGRSVRQRGTPRRPRSQRPPARDPGRGARRGYRRSRDPDRRSVRPEPASILCVANVRLRHRLIGYVRPSKTDGSHRGNLRRDAERRGQISTTTFVPGATMTGRSLASGRVTLYERARWRGAGRAGAW